MHALNPVRLLALLLLGVSAVTNLHAATYFVNNATGTGVDSPLRNGTNSTTDAWKTVAYAAQRMVAAGNTISVSAGTYAEASIINLAVGVNLQGAGYASTTITTTLSGVGTAGHLVKLVSGSVVNGNQTISGIKFDGKAGAVRQGIEIDRRSGVTLRDIWMENFSNRAVYISNTSLPAMTWPTMPADADYLYNINILNSTFKNSASVPTGANWGWGSVNAYHVRDSAFHHCTLDESGVGVGVPSNVGGFNFKGAFVRGLRIHNCMLTQRPHWPNTGRQKGFSIEFQNSLDCDFFDNRANGSISFSADNSRIHHNTIVMTGEGANEGLEAGGLNTVVASNYVEGASPGMYGGGSRSNGMIIQHNVFRACGGGVFLYEAAPGGCNNVKVYNNTFDLCGLLWNNLEGAVTVRIQVPTGTNSNLSVRNNLFTSLQGGIRGVALTGTNGGTANVTNITGTILDQNLYNSVPAGFLLNQGVTSLTNTNNLAGNPLYLGGTIPSPYYRLGTGSPAIGTGANVGLTYLGALPDKGAYVQDQTANAKIEAEMNYSVAAEVGATNISVTNMTLDSFKIVNLWDPGDSIRVHFYVATAGNYNVRVRLRSGYSSAPMAYWPSGYIFQLDSASTVTLVGNPATVTGVDPSGNACLGTMNATLSLTQGLHHLKITTAPGWFGGAVDYLQVQ